MEKNSIFSGLVPSLSALFINFLNSCQAFCSWVSNLSIYNFKLMNITFVPYLVFSNLMNFSQIPLNKHVTGLFKFPNMLLAQITQSVTQQLTVSNCCVWPILLPELLISSFQYIFQNMYVWYL